MTPKELIVLCDNAAHEAREAASRFYDLRGEYQGEPAEAWLGLYELVGDMIIVADVLAHKRSCLEHLFDLARREADKELDYEILRTTALQLIDIANEVDRMVQRGFLQQEEFIQPKQELEDLADYIHETAREIRRG